MITECACGHCNNERNNAMDELVLKALKEAIERYPEIIPYLKGAAKQVAEDGVEWHQRFEPNSTVHEYTPGKTELTQEDIDEALKEWDKRMPDYKGMLDADVEVEE